MTRRYSGLLTIEMSTIDHKRYLVNVRCSAQVWRTVVMPADALPRESPELYDAVAGLALWYLDLQEEREETGVDLIQYAAWDDDEPLVTRVRLEAA